MGGNDTITGFASGVDTASYTRSTGAVNVNLSSGTALDGLAAPTPLPTSMGS